MVNKFDILEYVKDNKLFFTFFIGTFILFFIPLVFSAAPPLGVPINYTVEESDILNNTFYNYTAYCHEGWIYTNRTTFINKKLLKQWKEGNFTEPKNYFCFDQSDVVMPCHYLEDYNNRFDKICRFYARK